MLFGIMLSVVHPCFADGALPPTTSSKVSTAAISITTAPSVGVLGLKWGDDATTVKKVLLAQAYTLNGELPNGIVFNTVGKTFDGQPVDSLLTLISSGGLAGVIIELAKPPANNVFDSFDKEVGKLTALYGAPSSAVHTYDPPYKEGDGNDAAAFSSDKADVRDVWLFRSAAGVLQQSAIVLNITNEEHIFISYANIGLFAKYQAEQQTATAATSTQTAPATNTDTPGQSPATAAVPSNDGSTLQISDAAAFFADFTGSDKHPAKTQFETDAQYAARLPKWDASQTAYFSITCDTGSISSVNYSYDLKAQRLTFFAGGKPNYEQFSHMINGLKGVACTILSTRDTSSGVGTNAFGASFDITIDYGTDYNLYIINPDDLPRPIFNKSTGEFDPTFSIDPTKGEELTKGGIRVIVGVQPIGYDASYNGYADRHRPTISEPYDQTISEESLECKVVSLLVEDGDGNKYFSWALGQK